MTERFSLSFFAKAPDVKKKQWGEGRGKRSFILVGNGFLIREFKGSNEEDHRRDHKGEEIDQAADDFPAHQNPVSNAPRWKKMKRPQKDQEYP